ncbi:MAG TPA: DUF5668 domain-containing protein [Clostridiaceae bacterium]
MKRYTNFWGVILIILGALLLFNKIYFFADLNIGNLWPLFVLLPGLAFEFSYFIERKSAGLLVPGGILTSLGSLFLFETFSKWSFAAYTWPVYPLGVAIGLLQLYIFGKHTRGLLIPVFILTMVSFLGFAVILYGSIYVWINIDLIVPITLISLGIILLIGRRKK